MIVDPTNLDQSNNDQIVPTDLVPVNELQDNSQQIQKGDNMTWAIPLIGAIFGMGVVGGIIWYSMKKEEEFGLIGKGGTRTTTEPSRMKMPTEIANVVKAMKLNAKQAGRPSDTVYVSGPNEPYNEWIVADNYERSPYSIIYRDGKWFYRNMWNGQDSKMRGGYNEAMSAASMFFTG